MVETRSQKIAVVATAMNVVNAVLFWILFCIPLNRGEMTQSVAERVARQMLWVGTLGSPVLFVVAGALLVYAVILGLPLEKHGELISGVAGVSLLAAFPMLFMGVRAWLGNFALVW